MPAPEETGRAARRRAARRVTLRRRRIALLTLAGCALLAGVALGARDEPAPRGRAVPRAEPAPRRATTAPASPRRAAADRLSLERQVGRLVVLRFAGPRVPGYARRALRERRAAGVILFGDNVERPGQLRALTRVIRRAGGRRTIVCVDQEGGQVRTVRWLGPEQSPPEQAAAREVGAAARAAGRGLRAAGINVSLAPVADVATVAGSALAGRAFSGDPRRAASAVRAAVRGWRAGGVAPTLKHFPGLGGARVNTDEGRATVPGAPVLTPFRAGIEAGAPLVMIGHAVHPAVDRDRIASQSPAVVEGLLRRRLGFRGVAITDSLEAEAVTSRGAVDRAAERSVRAGVDLVLTTGPGSALQVYRRLLARARASAGLRARVRESAGRVLRLQERL